jgi:hypothetical protein
MPRFSLISTIALATLGTAVAIPVLFGFPVLVAQAQVAVPALSDAIALHNAARDGTGAATDAVDALTVLTAAEPQNAVALAYLGSSYAISARDAGSVTDKIRFTNRGLRQLDEAVALSPDDIIVRLVRANVQKNLPTMFARAERLVEDMLALDKIYSAAPSPALAKPMIDIYAALAETQPDQGDWAAKLAAAQALAAGN